MENTSIVMPNSHRFYNLSNERVEHELYNNKKNATYMMICNSIGDFFCTEKKSEALEELYHFIHDNNHSPSQGNDTENTNFITSKINAFHKLQSLANDRDKELFSINRNNRCGIDFYIGSNLIKSLDYCELDYTRYQLSTHPDTKNIISSPEAEKYLYDLIDGMSTPSFNGTCHINTDPVPKMIATFNKLRLLANDDQKKLFYIDKNERDGIDFYIGSVLIKSLDHCKSSYALNELNTCPNIKKYINNTIKNALMTRDQPSFYDLEDLIDNMIYNSYNVIDGKQIVGCTNHDKHKNRELVKSFYNSLTPPQKKAICEVVSQDVFDDIIRNTLNFGPNFYEKRSLLNETNSIVMHHNDNSSDITVIKTFRRQPKEGYDQNYEFLKEMEKKEYGIEVYNQMYEHLKEIEEKDKKYRTLEIDAAFTISSNGDVNCSLLHVSDTLKPPVFSLDELKRTISNEIS